VDLTGRQAGQESRRGRRQLVGRLVRPRGQERCKSCGPGERGKRNAEKLRRKVEARLLTGAYQGAAKALWKDFRKEWEAKVGASMEPHTRDLTVDALNHFERLCNPVRTHFIGAQRIDHSVAKRRQERGRRRGSLVSPAAVNKELRHIRAALNVGKDWGYLPAAPRFRMLREPGRLPRHVAGDHFAAIYKACDSARMRDLPNLSAPDWWRALLTVGYMTGWRIGDLLAMRREDLDLEAGLVVARW
jgi:integrase